MSLVSEAKLPPAPTDGGALDPESRRRLRRRRQGLASLIMLVVFVLLAPALWNAVRGIWKIDEPREFAKYSGITTSNRFPGKQGEIYVFGLLSHSPLPEVTMTAARTILSEDSVAAATTLSICRAKPDQLEAAGIGMSIGVGSLSEYCSEVIPVEGQDLGMLGQNDSLIATVVPLGDGGVHVTGFDLAYDKDGRGATEYIAVDLRIGSEP